LLFASPTIGLLIKPPEGEQFSELYLLGPDHILANYPFNIEVDHSYSVFVGVANHLGASAYYVIYIKFCNESDQVPNATLGTPSSIQPLYEYRFTIQDNKNWESLLNFSVSNALISGDNSQINSIQMNGVTFNIDKPARWNTNNNTFKYQLLFELYISDIQTGFEKYNSRYVNLQLNLTQATAH
jgi:uncharacterized membrane protein